MHDHVLLRATTTTLFGWYGEWSHSALSHKYIPVRDVAQVNPKSEAQGIYLYNFSRLVAVQYYVYTNHLCIHLLFHVPYADFIVLHWNLEEKSMVNLACSNLEDLNENISCVHIKVRNTYTTLLSMFIYIIQQENVTSIKFGNFGQNAIFFNLAIRVNFFGCTFDLVLGNLSTTQTQLRMTRP